MCKGLISKCCIKKEGNTCSSCKVIFEEITFFYNETFLTTRYDTAKEYFRENLKVSIQGRRNSEF